jgi:hypothetical protein
MTNLRLGKGRLFQDIWHSRPSIGMFLKLSQYLLCYLLLFKVFKEKSEIYRKHVWH